MSMTSAPWEQAPSANAATSPFDDGRMSWPTTTAEPAAPVTRAKAAPMSRATSSSSSSGTTPRMS